MTGYKHKLPEGHPVRTMKSKAGALGASKRWGVPRNVRLHGLSDEQREKVLALVANLRREGR